MSPSITDVPGVLVGHAHDLEALTGCTVVLTTEGAVGGVDVSGGGPATRETDLLDPTTTVSQVHAIVLCGGSAFGLAAATGVVEWLRERQIGFETGVRRVPIVPAAAIFDLWLGNADHWADASMGYAACQAAGTIDAEGCIGVGAGATAGLLLGPTNAVKTGVGTWSETLADGTVVGALVVCNAAGDIYDERSGRIIAGARDPQSGLFADAMTLLRLPAVQAAMGSMSGRRHTTLAIVATDARLTKAETNRLAQMAGDALPRTIRPAHLAFEGDTVFALSTGHRAGPPISVLGAIAADVLARAIERSVLAATSLGGLPAARDLASFEF